MNDSDAGAILIRRGHRGPAVRDVQGRLARLGFSELCEDGEFGELTHRCVRQFQRERGLGADGIVGQETWRALIEAGFSLGDRLLWRTRNPMRGDDVHELQHRLNQLGFDAGAEDGIFGASTQAAVQEFQGNAGLVVDGVAGPATLLALRRLHRSHQSGGVGIRAREREALRRLSQHGLTGARILIDPAGGHDEPGQPGIAGASEAELSWAIATRVSSRLHALGAQAPLSRGPRTTPAPSERARLANELAVDAVVSIGMNATANPAARGASAYYFGTDRFVSEAGRQLADLLLTELVTAGWRPDCRAHPMTWPILRETRMPAVVVEPGFLTSPHDGRRLRDPGGQDGIAAALTRAVGSFFEAPRGAPLPA